MKTIAYMRVSTDRQTEGNGIEQQRAAICAWSAATEQKPDDWVTESESGMKLDREEVQGLLARAKAGEVQRVVVDRVDRLGRDLLVSETLYRAFRAAGCEVVSVKEQFDNSPQGSFMRIVFMGLAEMQRAEWLGRMKQCKSVAVARKGTYGGGRNPYGYRSIGGGALALDPDGAKLVRRVFELKTAGCSLTRIAAQLDQEGFRTLKGTRLHPEQVKRILARSAVYAGQAPIQKVELEPGIKPQQPRVL